MTKYSIKLTDLFGTSYYRYKLGSTHYNTTPSQTNIIITCTVKNIFGVPVSNKELTLYHQNTIQGTATTNANGIATWTVENLNNGTHNFIVGDSSLIINVTGWRLLETKNNNQVKVYGDGENIAVSIQDSFTLTKDGSRVISTISTEYAPSQILTTPYHPTSPTVMLTINGNGAITVYNPTSATSGIARVYVTYPLKAKMV